MSTELLNVTRPHLDRTRTNLDLSLLAKFFFVISVLLMIGNSATAQTTESICKNSSWSNCGVAVKQVLDNNPPTNPHDIVALGMLWAASYGKQYDALRASGHLDRSTPNSQKIFEEVSSKLNPVDIAKDKAIDALVKRFLPRLAFLFKFAETPLGVALKAFFSSTDIASDLDELNLINDDLSKRFADLLEPFLQADWNDKLKAAAKSSMPALGLP